MKGGSGDGLWRVVVTAAKKAVLTSPRSVRRLVNEEFYDDLEPEFLWIEATSSCGSRCAFCDIWQTKSPGHPLTPSEIGAGDVTIG